MLYRKVLLLGYFYLMIYKPEFIFIFPSVNTFFGLLGLLFYIRHKNNDLLKRECGAYFTPLFYAYIPVVVVCLVSLVINMSTELYYVKYFLSIVLYYFMAYLGALGFRRIYGKITPMILVNYFVAVALMHVFISFAMYAIPKLHDIVMTMIRMNIGEADAMERTFAARLQGFGATFYVSGLINGFILIMVGFTLYTEKCSILQKLYFLVSFVLIFAIGTMIARTILVGAAVGFFLVLLSLLKVGNELYKNLISIFVFCSLLWWGWFELLPNSNIEIDTISEFGFEVFRMIMEGNSSSHSTDSMISMYDTMPDNLITWMIGDSQWSLPNGAYYKEVDIGYLRNIFYFGIIGSFFFYFYNFIILKKCILRGKIFGETTKWVFVSLLMYTIILNFKGTVDLYFYILPYYFCNRTFNYSVFYIWIMLLIYLLIAMVH